MRPSNTRPGHKLLTVAVHAAPAYDIAYMPRRERLAAAGPVEIAKLLDPASVLLALSLFPDTPPAVASSILLSPDGRHTFVGGVHETVLVGDAFTRQTELTLAGHTDMMRGLALNGIYTQRHVS